MTRTLFTILTLAALAAAGWFVLFIAAVMAAGGN